MKFITIFFLSFFCFSCSQNNKSSNTNKVNNNELQNNEKYGTELINSDFLKFSNPEKTDSLKTEIKKSFNIYDKETNKFAQIDAEELSEFSFDFFLPQLNRILEKRNLNLIVKTANDYEKTNDIIINGNKINLYTKKEFENHTFWDIASRNFFRKVNEILKDKNSDEKFYLLYGGNDLSTLLW